MKKLETNKYSLPICGGLTFAGMGDIMKLQHSANRDAIRG